MMWNTGEGEDAKGILIVMGTEGIVDTMGIGYAIIERRIH